jgi:3-phenylpropionate/trans-cinnamate dioxygenase ferredoxin reductase subunit
MTTSQNIVIVGAGLAGATAAETLRSEGFEGPVTLLGEETARPYERPPLSKTYLRQEDDFESAAVHPADYYQENDIDLRTGTAVTAIDVSASTVEVSSGERIAYDRLLVATGATPRLLTVPGSELDGVHYLRSVADADAIHKAITASMPVVVIGAGWIGCEVAASARQLGADVTVIDIATVPLERVLGTEVGTIYRDLHADQGVQFRLGVGIESIGGAGRVEEIRLTDGTALPAGVVVAGIGVLPRTDIAEGAGLQLENGIVTDQYLATSVAGIYAAGDVANAFHPTYGRRVRLEHWSSALNQGPVAAINLLGKPTAYEKLPYFFSDQYDFGMEYRGLAVDPDEVVFRGSTTQREFIAFWLHQGRVMAAMNANIWDQGEQMEELIASGARVEPPRLADTDIELRSLIQPR